MFSFITLLLTLETGFMPDNFNALGSEQYSAKMLYADFLVEAEAFDSIFASYGNKMVATHLEWVTVVPQTQTYTYSFGFRHGGFEAGLRHLCTHPTQSLLADGVRSDFQLYRWQNEIYMRYSVKIGSEGVLCVD